MEKILVADDEREIAELLEACLSAGGYEVIKCYSAADVRKAPLSEVGLAILDIMLPDGDGFSLCRELRERYLFPIIMLTARDSDADKIVGLSSGADDYMTKPFERDELVARVEAILRRHNNNFKTTYSNGRVELDFAGKIFRVDGKDVKLSGKMYDILEYLIRNRNMIISKEQLFNRIWGFDSETIITVTEVYISNLRKLLDKYGLREHLRTIKSVGYMWSEDPAQEA